MIVRGVAKRHDVETAGGKISQWFTPPWLAKRAVELLGVKPGMRVLDLGAGAGALSKACIVAGATVTAVEIDPDLAPQLEHVLGGHGLVEIGDVLTLELERHDLAICNPPWEADLETRFLRRALELAPKALGIVSGDAHSTPKRFANGWQYMRQLAVEHVVPRPSFNAAGTTGQEECDLVLVGPRARPRAPGEVDLVEVSWLVRPKGESRR
jgi:predicted RNA methylase